MTKLGGRKFIALIILSAVGVALEMWAPKGLTTVMASFLAGLGAVYTGGNVLRAKTQPGSADTSEITAQISTLTSVLQQVLSNPDAQKGTEILTGMHDTMQEVLKSVSNMQKLFIAGMRPGSAVPTE